MQGTDPGKRPAPVPPPFQDPWGLLQLAASWGRAARRHNSPISARFHCVVCESNKSWTHFPIRFSHEEIAGAHRTVLRDLGDLTWLPGLGKMAAVPGCSPRRGGLAARGEFAVMACSPGDEALRVVQCIHSGVSIEGVTSVGGPSPSWSPTVTAGQGGGLAPGLAGGMFEGLCADNRRAPAAHAGGGVRHGDPGATPDDGRPVLHPFAGALSSHSDAFLESRRGNPGQ